MKKILSKFDRIMAAVTFAEAGEFESAREFIREGERATKRPENRPEMRKNQPIQKSR
jgi:hypothetical protein